MKLDRRLLAAADLVRPGKAVCDVGTDHGYLAVWLAEQGTAAKITACDINEAPLRAARRTIAAGGRIEEIRLIRSDGLLDVPSELAEDIVLCGMGGELIGRILLDCPYAKEPQRRFILQPMTRAADLRRILCENGFSILKETPVFTGKHRYTLLYAAWTGEIFTPDSLFCAIGKIPNDPSPEATEWLHEELRRIERVAEGLRGRKAAGPPEELACQIRAVLAQRSPLGLPQNSGHFK